MSTQCWDVNIFFQHLCRLLGARHWTLGQKGSLNPVFDGTTSTGGLKVHCCVAECRGTWLINCCSHSIVCSCGFPHWHSAYCAPNWTQVAIHGYTAGLLPARVEYKLVQGQQCTQDTIKRWFYSVDWKRTGLKRKCLGDEKGEILLSARRVRCCVRLLHNIRKTCNMRKDFSCCDAAYDSPNNSTNSK